MKNFRLLMQFLHGDGRKYIIAILSVLLMTIFSAISPLVIKITIDSIIGDEPLNLPQRLYSLIQQKGGIEYIRNNLWIVLAVLVVITLLQGIFMYLKSKLSAAVAQDSSKRLREKLYDHLERLPFDYHAKAQTGDIVQRCTSDIETVQNFVSGQFIDALQIILQVVVALIIMLLMSPRYTLSYL